jgi:lysophospholipid acyltransferase (LPLAT)-like uncharacterized protein
MSDAQNGDDTQRDGGFRGNTGGRQMTPLRRLGYAIGGPLLAGLVRFLWWTWRVEIVSGRDYVEAAVSDDRAYVPCYWHRDILVCLMVIRGWIRRGFRAAIIISPSVDGEVPARIARAWGAEVVRGSAKRTGALAMRDMHEVMKRGVSIVTAADGPVGPAYYFKSGVLMTSRIGSAPMLPMGCAASSAWQFNTWDEFRVPKPFSRVAIAIGEPVEVPARAKADELDALRVRMQDAVNTLSEESKESLSG